MVTFLFKGLGQNIVPLGEDEITLIHKERVEKILDSDSRVSLLQELSKRMDLSAGVNYQEEEEEKKEIMDSVVEELKEHGDIDGRNQGNDKLTRKERVGELEEANKCM